MRRHLRSPLALAGLAAALGLCAGAVRPAAAGAPTAVSAADAIRAAIVSRMGDGARVDVTVLDLTEHANVFRDARPDPAADLAHAVRFTLMTDEGAALPVAADVHVVTDYAIARHAITRGATLTAADVAPARGTVADGPLKRLPTSDELIGARTLRPIAAGATVLASFVRTRRPVEAGDRVIVVASAGAVEVTATFVAADGGNVGDVIRVVNPDTRRYLRARVVKAGLVEVGE